MVGSLTISLGLGLAMLTGGYMLAAVLEPKIWLSNPRDRVTLWVQGLNTHSYESVIKAL